MLQCRGKYSVGIYLTESAFLTENVHKLSQFPLGGLRNHSFADFMYIVIRFALKFFGNDMSAEKRRYYGPRPARGGVSNGGQRLQFGFHRESVTGLGFHGCGAVLRHFTE